MKERQQLTAADHTPIHIRREEITNELRDLRKESKNLVDSITDIWSPLGSRAMMLREAFKNVELPILSRSELIDQLEGEDKIITAPNLDGTMTVVSVADFVDALGDFVDQVVPLKDWETLVHQIIKHEHAIRKKGGKRLLRRIENNHLMKILENRAALHVAFPEQRNRAALDEFNRRKPAYEALMPRKSETALEMVRELQQRSEYIHATLTFELIEVILVFLENQQADLDIVLSKTGSATTHLNNAESLLNTASGYVQNVLNATQLTNTVSNYNTSAYSSIDSASQLLAQAIADLAAAEAAAQKIPGNAEAQGAVAKAQAKLEQVQNQYNLLIQQMAQAEAHKDILAIPEICINIHCVEEDPCCDDDWNNVNVCIQNTSNTDVPQVCGTTSGNGTVNICGRFGDSDIVITSTGPDGWNETRYVSTGNTNMSYTISTDLSGWE